MSTERIWELVARKLAQEASANELEELEQLLRTHPDLHVPVQAITDLWLQGSSPLEEAILAAGYQQHLARMNAQGVSIGQSPNDNAFLLEGARKPRGIYWKYVGIAAAVLATAWFFYWMMLPSAASRQTATVKNQPSEIITKNGSRTKVQLPDGTQVWLNAGSKLTYDKEFNTTLREVTLWGEGYFDVVRNEKKPFIIHTAQMDIKVLGTQFNLRSYPNDKTAEAALIHGSIEVRLKNRPAEKIILKPHEKIVVNNNDTLPMTENIAKSQKDQRNALVVIKGLSQQDDSTYAETSWLDNKLVFTNESFPELATRLERWYGVTIRLTDEHVSAMRFTGVFEDETIGEALRGLAITSPFTYRIQGKSITISR
ncbi:FecR family protein [Paraflavitalea pollutisoli]|uniref:FecR family protein n=1 Tax=Paraflavitalea pollutisoli TaxID=3034143 RepID=UPI0023EAAE12|nr:FecR domain-containing protein [Paraflavitalea sp. H1-2-19X]